MWKRLLRRYAPRKDGTLLCSSQKLCLYQKFSEIFLQLHISEKTGRGVPKVVEKYGKAVYEFRTEFSVMMSCYKSRIITMENEITRIIKDKLAQIETRENIRILYACESGSRAWGFACDDSDYDVRFVYVRPLEDYLKINNLPDFLECELNEIYDINGWDFKKFFKQLYKSNPVIFEWADSPIVYKTTTEWESVKSMMGNYAKVKPMIHHYLGLAKHIIKDSFIGDEISYKKYRYVSRAVLAASWIFYKRKPAPTKYSTLCEAELTDDDKRWVSHVETTGDSDRLDDLTREKTRGKRIPTLEIFYRNRIAIIENGIKDWKDDKTNDLEKLDKVFLKIIKAGVAGGV